MKLFPWILTIVFATCSAWLYSKNKQAETELAALREQVEELNAAVAEAEEVAGAQVDTFELERLRKENEEIYKLRGEVSKLRRDNQQLTLKVQQQAAQYQQVQSELMAVVNSDEPRVQHEDAQMRLLREQGNMCVGSMTVVEDAKSQWAHANGKQGGAIVTLAEIMPYLPNLTMPSCAGGGTYQLNEIGVPVTCSIPEHSLLP